MAHPRGYRAVLPAVAAAALVVVSIACGAGDSDRTDIPFETVSQSRNGYLDTTPKPKLRIARNEDQLKELWYPFAMVTDPPPPVLIVNFEEEMIIGVFSSHASTGYSLAIDRISGGQDEWLVEATLTVPCADCGGYGIFTFPHHIVRTQQSGLPISVSLTEVVRERNETED